MVSTSTAPTSRQQTERMEKMKLKRSLVPSDSARASIPLGRAEGKPLKTIEVCQYEDSLDIDVQFEDDHVLELTFHVGFQATARLIKWDKGNSRVVQNLRPTRQPRIVYVPSRPPVAEAPLRAREEKTA